MARLEIQSRNIFVSDALYDDALKKFKLTVGDQMNRRRSGRLAPASAANFLASFHPHYDGRHVFLDSDKRSSTD